MQALPATLCHLDGDYLPLRDAKISVLDRGFIFGDGIYEVIPAYDGHLFCLDEHLARLERSLAEVRIANPHDREGWRALAQRLVDSAANEATVSVYIQVTRGVAPRDLSLIHI